MLLSERNGGGGNHAAAPARAALLVRLLDALHLASALTARAASLLPRQFFSRYPVLNIQEMTKRHIAKNPMVIEKLVTTLTSAVP